MSTYDPTNQYDIKPANWDTNKNPEVQIQVDPNSPQGQTTSSIEANIDQSKTNAKYDTVSMDVKPLAGGYNNKKTKYKVEYKNKKLIYEFEEDIEEDEVVKKFIKENKFKNDQFIKLSKIGSRTKNFYHIRDPSKRVRYRKLYD